MIARACYYLLLSIALVFFQLLVWLDRSPRLDLVPNNFPGVVFYAIVDLPDPRCMHLKRTVVTPTEKNVK